MHQYNSGQFCTQLFLSSLRILKASAGRGVVLVASCLCFVGSTEITRAETTTESRRVRLMSYNIHHGRGTDKKIDLQRIADVITRAEPDVVALQEVDVITSRSGGVDQLAELARLTNMQGRFAKGRDFDGGDYGQAVLSRWPISSLQVHQLSGPTVADERIAAVAVISAGRDLPQFPVIFTHLHHDDNQLRMNQAREVTGVVNDLLPTSVAILMGDLNAEPSSDVMEFLLRDWADTTTDEDLTYPANQPAKKIDWIMVPRNGGWRVARGEVVAEKVASDHRPVLVELIWDGY